MTMSRTDCNGRHQRGYRWRWIATDSWRAPVGAASTRSSTGSRGQFCEPFFLLYFRMSRIGREHIPREGGVIIAANHRSFLDPFVIGTLVRRPVYFVAKRELFTHRGAGLVAELVGRLSRRPRQRRPRRDGHRPPDPRARRLRRGLPGGHAHASRRPRHAQARRRAAWRWRPARRSSRSRCSAPSPCAAVGASARTRCACAADRRCASSEVEDPSPQLARAVMQRVWPNVELQWEWLGGTAPLRRAAIVGAGAWGTGLAVALSRAGVEVELGCRTAEQARTLARTRVNEHYLPDVALPDAVGVTTAGELALSRADIVCFAVPAAALPDAVDSARRRDPRPRGRARALQGPRRAARHAAQRLRRRARQRARRRLHRRPRPRRRRARQRRLARRRLDRRRLRDAARARPAPRRLRRVRHERRRRRRACRHRQERRRARRRGRGRQRAQCRRRRRRQGLRRGRRVRAHAGRQPADVRRPRGRGRPCRDRRRAGQPQPPRR